MSREILRAAVAVGAMLASAVALALWAPTGGVDDRPRLIPWNATDAEYEAHVARQRALIRGAERGRP